MPRLVVASLLLALGAGCVKTQDHSVTIAPPSVPPSASQILSDAFVATKVRAQLVALDVDSAIRLGISVHDGNVRLSGVVRSEAERLRVDRAVRKVAGVRALDDEIRVNPKAPAFSGGDFALAARVTAALAAQTGVNAANIRASAQDGVVTLRGRVPSQSIKQTALETAGKLDGVKRVVDEIRVAR